MGKQVSRRRLLQGAAGGVLVSAAGAGAAVLKPAAAGMHVLSNEEMGVVHALCEVLFPREPMGISGLDAGVPAEVDRLVAQWLDDVRRPAFRYVLRGLEWGTYSSRGRRFSALPLADRHEVFQTWSDTEVHARRLAADSLRVVFSMAYFRSAEVQRAMGYVRLCSGRPT